MSIPPCKGSIPACAGEPPVVGAIAGLEGVYPRVCGGTQVAYDGGFLYWGLSPRVRGNLAASRP